MKGKLFPFAPPIHVNSEPERAYIPCLLLECIYILSVVLKLMLLAFNLCNMQSFKLLFKESTNTTVSLLAFFPLKMTYTLRPLSWSGDAICQFPKQGSGILKPSFPHTA